MHGRVQEATQLVYCLQILMRITVYKYFIEFSVDPVSHSQCTE